jgi:hypothetical protein
MNTFPHARRRGRGIGGEIKCFFYGKVGHKYFECTHRKIDARGESHISEAQRRNVQAEDAKGRKSLMMRKILLNPEKEMENLV